MLEGPDRQARNGRVSGRDPGCRVYVLLVERARQELKGFQRIAIQPNETKTVTLTVKAEDLAYWDEKQNSWVVEADRVKFMVGASSAGVRLEKTIEVTEK